MSPTARRRILPLLLILVLPSVGAACCCGPFDSPGKSERQKLADAQERWRDRNATDYTLTVARSCECLPESTRAVRVQVVSGQPVSHVYADDGQPANPITFRQFDTVEELFDIIGDALESGADSVRATYNPLGFPTDIQIDFDENAVDDEVGYRVSLVIA